MTTVLASLSVFGLFNNKDDDTDAADEGGPTTLEEDRLKDAIKSGMVAQRSGEFDKAEELLHSALKLAVETKNEDGVTYVYDVMANAALERVRDRLHYCQTHDTLITFNNGLGHKVLNYWRTDFLEGPGRIPSLSWN